MAATTPWRGVVDNNSVDLAVVQGLHSGQTVIVSNDAVLAEVVGAVDVTGGAALGADDLAGQIVSGSNVRISGTMDGLDALGVGVGEVHDLLALVGNGTPAMTCRSCRSG